MTSFPARHPVSFIETTAFEQKAPTLLGPNELRGLQLLLADDPLRGTPVPDFPEMLRLDYASCIIFYAVAPTLLKVYLLDIEKGGGGSPPPTKEEAQLLRKILNGATQGAIFVAVRKGLSWLWDYFKNEPPMP